MIVTPVRTPVVTPHMMPLNRLIDQSIAELAEGSIVVITSKIVALCEGSVAKRTDTDHETLITREASQYLAPEQSRYGHHFTITNHTLIASAGIDESNADNQFVLWPRNPLQTARHVRDHLAARFSLKQVGVIITDSTCQPLRRGTSGIALAYAGFHGVKSYVGSDDLFGHRYRATHANISGGLAAAAVVTMGEGTEQTPLAILTDLPFVAFESTAPDAAELNIVQLKPEDDLFAPFLQAVDWQTGDGTATPN